MNKTHLPSVLTLIVVALGILFLLALAGIFAVSSLMLLFSGGGVEEMIAAFAFGFESVLLLACAWFISQKARGQAAADQPYTFPFARWQVVPGIVIILLGIAIGGGIAATGIHWIGWLALPLLTVLVILTPIWLVIGFSSNGMQAGARWRFFAVLGLSMTVAPLVMVVLEIVFAAILVIAGSVYLVVTMPDVILELSTTLQFLAEQPENIELALETLAPYLMHPAVMLAGFGFIAVLVPLIEELFKPLAVWLFARQIESPAQGFVLGGLSGAAFALFESLNMGANGSTAWAVVVGARIGTGILHVTTSAIVGWGIVSAFREKRFGRLLACYAGAVLLHGLWNAAAVGMMFSGIGALAGDANLSALVPALICVLLGMGVGMGAALIALNRRFRREEQARRSSEAEDADERVQLSA
jgi:hypothetical protein